VAGVGVEGVGVEVEVGVGVGVASFDVCRRAARRHLVQALLRRNIVDLGELSCARRVRQNRQHLNQCNLSAKSSVASTDLLYRVLWFEGSERRQTSAGDKYK
jgi:hypothetical protein